MEENTSSTKTETPKKDTNPVHEKTKIFVIVMLALGLAVGSYLLIRQQQDEAHPIASTSIKSYQQCVDAGNPVMESYPEQCQTVDGVTFVNPDVQPIEPEDNQETTRTYYQSDVTKFSLDLSDSLAVLEKQDGPFEGGPVTIVEIASFKLGSGNVLDSSYPSETIIYAVPKNGVNTYTLQDLIDSRLSNTFEPVAVENPVISVDGENVRAYYSDGLFSEVHIFWETDEAVFHLSGGSKGGFTPTGYVSSVLEGFQAL